MSEQGKTTIRREENERGIIHDIKKQYVFRHHPDCILYLRERMAGRHSKRLKHEEPNVVTSEYQRFRMPPKI